MHLLCAVGLLSVAGCGLFKKSKDKVVIPERLLEQGAEYVLEKETPIYFEDPEKAEVEHLLAEGVRVRYMGPGKKPPMVVIRTGDGKEGFVDASVLGELAGGESPRRPSQSEPPLPRNGGNPPPPDESAIPRIRTDDPLRIAPLPIQPRL